MATLGIIAEYNPFHNGHLHHLLESKKQTGADSAIAVMSGDFVQRGEPAMFDKWTRAEMAVKNGVDLVLELPFVHACNNAEYFAKGAVRLLDNLGVVSYLSFGSESGDLKKLTKLACILTEESDDWKVALKKHLDEGSSFPKARHEATRDIAGDDIAELLTQPNNILAIEYLKQLKVRSSKMIPHTITRFGAGYYEVDKETKIAGATALRNLIFQGNIEEALEYVPDESKPLILESEYITSEAFYQVIAAATLIYDKAELRRIFSATEGLENRVKDALSLSKDFKTLVTETKSKRYTETRIRRFLFHILFDLTKETMHEIEDREMTYGRVLAFNETGAALLREIKKKDVDIPIITNISKEKSETEGIELLANYDILASDLYNLIKYGEFFTRSDYRVVPYMKKVEK